MSSEPAGTFKSQDSDWPELTLYPHSCLKKKHSNVTPVYVIPVFLSISASLLTPLAYSYIHLHAFFCLMCLVFPGVSDWATFYWRERACSLHKGCPISWLLGLLIGAGRRKRRGPICVLGWTLWLESMVCDAKRQRHMWHKYTSWQGHDSCSCHPSILIDDQTNTKHRVVKHIWIKHFRRKPVVVFSSSSSCL